MTSRDFCYWLQGFFEVTETGKLSPETTLTLSAQQVTVVRQHLAMVFKHEIDPSMGPQAHQDELNAIHAKPQIGGTGPNGEVYRC